MGDNILRGFIFRMKLWNSRHLPAAADFEGSGQEITHHRLLYSRRGQEIADHRLL